MWIPLKSVVHFNRYLYGWQQSGAFSNAPWNRSNGELSDCRERLSGLPRNWQSVYKYGVSDEEFSGNPRGTCTTTPSDEVKTVLQRTQEALREGFGQFNIVGSNCEDFALYCKTGQRSQTSGQYLSAMRRIHAARQAAVTGYKSPIVYAGCVLG